MVTSRLDVIGRVALLCIGQEKTSGTGEIVLSGFAGSVIGEILSPGVCLSGSLKWASLKAKSQSMRS